MVRANEVIEEINRVEVEYVRLTCKAWDKSFEQDLNMIAALQYNQSGG